MKRQIRSGVFETNSSSIHSICISKKPVTKYPKEVWVHCGEYGWEHDCVTDTISYLYAGIMSGSSTFTADYYLDKLREILEKHGVEMKIGSQREMQWSSVDHGYELSEFLEDVFSDEDKLMRFLFSPASCVYTGNDNCLDEDDNPMCFCASPTTDIEDADDRWVEVPNPNHYPEDYDYYLKGN